jgi:phosphonate transport system substrate-binding protein
MKHIKTVMILLCFCTAFIMACGETKTESVSKVSKRKMVKHKRTLRIGLIPARNIFLQRERYKPIAVYLSKKIDMNIELKILTRYGNIIDNFDVLKLDGAFFGSFTYVLAHAKLGVEVIARPERDNGVSTYYGLIFVRKDSGIRNINDMKGKVFAFVDKATTAGHLFPLAYFKKNGVDNYSKFLKENYFAGTHEDTIIDVLDRKADIGAAKNSVFFSLTEHDDRISKDLHIIEKSLNVPENGLALKKSMDASIKENIQQALINMHNDPEGKEVLKSFGANKFIKTNNDDYENVRALVQQTGIDIKTYEYMND